MLQINLLTPWHDDYSLFIEWKWIIIEVSILIVFMLNKEEELVGLAVLGYQSWKRRRKERKERQAHLCNTTEIQLIFFLFVSLKMFLCITYSSTAYFSFSTQTIGTLMSQKKILNN